MQFGRQVEVVIGGRKIEYPPFEIDFVVEFCKDEDVDTVAQCTVYNISDDTADKIKLTDKVVINAGYDGSIGTVYAGEVFALSRSAVGTDKVFYFEAFDRVKDWLKLRIDKTYASGTSARSIIDDMLLTHGLKAGEYFLPVNYVYQRGRTIAAPLKDALKSVLLDCRAGYYVAQGQFYIGQPHGKTMSVLSATTGLIGTPQIIHDNRGRLYAVRCLLNNRLQPGGKVRIESSITGEYEILSGRHIKDNEFTTEMEVSQWRGD